MPVKKGSLGVEISTKRAHRTKIVEEIEASNEEILSYNRKIAEVQERLKVLHAESMKAAMTVQALMELNGEDPQEDVVPPRRQHTSQIIPNTDLPEEAEKPES